MRDFVNVEVHKLILIFERRLFILLHIFFFT